MHGRAAYNMQLKFTIQVIRDLYGLHPIDTRLVVCIMKRLVVCIMKRLFVCIMKRLAVCIMKCRVRSVFVSGALLKLLFTDSRGNDHFISVEDPVYNIRVHTN